MFPSLAPLIRSVALLVFAKFVVVPHFLETGLSNINRFLFLQVLVNSFWQVAVTGKNGTFAPSVLLVPYLAVGVLFKRKLAFNFAPEVYGCVKGAQAR